MDLELNPPPANSSPPPKVPGQMRRNRSSRRRCAGFWGVSGVAVVLILAVAIVTILVCFCQASVRFTMPSNFWIAESGLDCAGAGTGFSDGRDVKWAALDRSVGPETRVCEVIAMWIPPPPPRVIEYCFGADPNYRPIEESKARYVRTDAAPVVNVAGIRYFEFALSSDEVRERVIE